MQDGKSKPNKINWQIVPYEQSCKRVIESARFTNLRDKALAFFCIWKTKQRFFKLPSPQPRQDLCVWK